MEEQPQKRRSYRSGLLTVLGIFLFGGIFVGGLFLVARQNASPEYKAAVPDVPAERIRLVSCNLQWSPPSPQMVESLKALKPDFVLLQQTFLKDAEALAVALGMQHQGKLQLYYSPTNPSTTQAPGNAIMARHPLYQGRAIADQGATDAGIWVEPVIGGKRFLLGCADLTPPPLAAPAAKLRREAINRLEASWNAIQEPCIIAALIPAAFESTSPQPPTQRFRLSAHWAYHMPISGIPGNTASAIEAGSR